MLLLACALVLSTQNVSAAKKVKEGPVKASQRFVHNYGGRGNPYLPLWEHVPDGEPKLTAPDITVHISSAHMM